MSLTARYLRVREVEMCIGGKSGMGMMVLIFFKSSFFSNIYNEKFKEQLYFIKNWGTTTCGKCAKDQQTINKTILFKYAKDCCLEIILNWLKEQIMRLINTIFVYK